MKKSDILLAKIRNGEEMTRREKISLIIDLSIPSMLAQITTVMMFSSTPPWWDISARRSRQA